VQAFHDEIAFFVRTVFFLFLGASFSLGLSGTWEATSRIPGLHLLDRTTALVVFGALLILVAIIVSRSLAVRLVTTRKRPDRRELFPVFGRGLDTAVLATVPFLATSYTSGEAYKALFDPWKPVFLNVSLLTVLFTIVTSGIAVFLYERRLGGRRLKAQEKPPERPAPERGPETAVPAKPRKPKNA
jgi:NhaP-type Na+/H+ or K+/H+ antiporter